MHSPGNLPVFWAYRNKVLSEVFENSQNMSPCFKLKASDAIYTQEDCSTKLGVLCKCSFIDATLFYRNGTIEQIPKNKVQQFCDPHAIVYDDIISNCVINL